MSTLTDAPPSSSSAAPTNRVRIGDHDYRVEFPSARKASTALKLLRRVSATVKDVTKALGEYERDYAVSHRVELDRVQARMRYPARVVYGDDEQPLRKPDGELELASPLDGLTEEDWERSGHTLKLPMAPTTAERIGAVFDLALEDAEDELYRVLALFTLSNDEVARYRKSSSLDDELAARADVLLDEGGLDEVLELAVVAGEVIDSRFRRKIDELGDRVGNALRLLGVDWAPTEAPTPETPQTTPETPQTDDSEEEGSSNSRPTSSTGSPSATDGRPTSPSTPTTPSSSRSETD